MCALLSPVVYIVTRVQNPGTRADVIMGVYGTKTLAQRALRAIIIADKATHDLISAKETKVDTQMQEDEEQYTLHYEKENYTMYYRLKRHEIVDREEHDGTNALDFTHDLRSPTQSSQSSHSTVQSSQSSA